MLRDEMLSRIKQLRAEIEELDRANRNFLKVTHPSPFEQDMQDVRMERLEQIKREIERLAAKKIQ